MRRFAAVLLVLAVLVGAAIAGLIGYVRPESGLTLDSKPLNLPAKAAELIRSGKAEFFLSQNDINNLVKAKLGEAPEVTPELRIHGARVTLNEDKLTVKIAGQYRELLSVGAEAAYHLEWRDPNLVAIPEALAIRSLKLPVSLLHPIVIPIGSQLPPAVGIRSVTFRDGGAVIGLKLKL